MTLLERYYYERVWQSDWPGYEMPEFQDLAPAYKRLLENSKEFQDYLFDLKTKQLIEEIKESLLPAFSLN